MRRHDARIVPYWHFRLKPIRQPLQSEAGEADESQAQGFRSALSQVEGGMPYFSRRLH